MDGTARTITYEYDAHGNRTLMDTHAEYMLSFAYDGMDRMTLIQERAVNPVANTPSDSPSQAKSRLTCQ